MFAIMSHWRCVALRYLARRHAAARRIVMPIFGFISMVCSSSQPMTRKHRRLFLRSTPDVRFTVGLKEGQGLHAAQKGKANLRS